MHRFRLVLLLAGLPAWGCAVPPDRAPWKVDQPVIQPMGDDGGASGSLVVETVLFGTDQGKDRRRAFFLYNEKGSYLTHYPNDSMSPVSLPAGRYVVVTSIMNINKRVQVVITTGHTTTVHLNDFKSAPEAE